MTQVPKTNYVTCVVALIRWYIICFIMNDSITTKQIFIWFRITKSNSSVSLLILSLCYLHADRCTNIHQKYGYQCGRHRDYILKLPNKRVFSLVYQLCTQKETFYMMQVIDDICGNDEGMLPTSYWVQLSRITTGTGGFNYVSGGFHEVSFINKCFGKWQSAYVWDVPLFMK